MIYICVKNWDSALNAFYFMSSDPSYLPSHLALPSPTPNKVTLAIKKQECKRRKTRHLWEYRLHFHLRIKGKVPEVSKAIIIFLEIHIFNETSHSLVVKLQFICGTSGICGALSLLLCIV